MAITRTPMVDDDGSGTTGTIINAAWKVELYDQIDAAIASGSLPSLAASQLLGRGAAGGTGPAQAITLGLGLTMSGTTLAAATAGTWAPKIEGDTGASGQTYASSHGLWFRVGDIVIISGHVALTNKGTMTGVSAIIAGLPFPVAPGPGFVASGYVGIGYFANLAAGIVTIGAYGSVNKTVLQLVQVGNTPVNTVGLMTPAFIGNTTELILGGHYVAVP